MFPDIGQVYDENNGISHLPEERKSDVMSLSEAIQKLHCPIETIYSLMH